MIRRAHTVLVLIVAVACLASCDSLVPPEPVGFTGVVGTVTFIRGEDGWPSDSINDVRVVLFETAPTAADSILPFILSGRAVFSTSLPQRVASAPYSIDVPSAPRTFRYVVVAMQTGPNVLQDWRMAALHTTDGSTPATVVVERGQTVGVDFVVDFSNLPPQPF